MKNKENSFPPHEAPEPPGDPVQRNIETILRLEQIEVQVEHLEQSPNPAPSPPDGGPDGRQL